MEERGILRVGMKSVDI